MKKEILFGYACAPSCGCFGSSDGGFSVEITCEGQLLYKTYTFSDIEVTRISYNISQYAVGKIQHILSGNKALVTSLRPHLNNGSYDGSCNQFIFNGKEIISWNISKSDVRKLKDQNPLYYQEYKENIEQENRVLSLFDAITHILKDYGFTLTLYRFAANQHPQREIQQG